MRLLRCSAALLLLTVLAACERAPTAKESPQPPQYNDAATCQLLDDQDMAGLTGVEGFAEVSAGPHDFGKACRWEAGGGSVVIDVTSATSTEWLAKLPSLIDKIERSAPMSDSDTAEFAKTRDLIEVNTDSSPDGACVLFSKMAVIGGSPKGANYTLNTGTEGDLEAVTAQMCADGRLTVFILAQDEIERSEEMRDALMTTLQTAHDRAVTAK